MAAVGALDEDEDYSGPDCYSQERSEDCLPAPARQPQSPSQASVVALKPYRIAGSSDSCTAVSAVAVGRQAGPASGFQGVPGFQSLDLGTARVHGPAEPRDDQSEHVDGHEARGAGCGIGPAD